MEIYYNEKTFKNVCLSESGYHGVVAHLETLADGKELLEKYKSIYEHGTYFLETSDERIMGILCAYEDYLKWAMINKPNTDESKEYIFNKLKPFLPLVSNYDDLEKDIKTYFEDKGYYIQFGVTWPYPTMYLWGKQTITNKMIELPEGNMEIEVCEMDDVITSGWLNYLSMSKIGDGGWVTSRGSNYFKDKYDTSSNEFKISLLKHEAQHFLDLKNHPKMKSADLEYRAKLVELIYHDDIGTFLSFLNRANEQSDRDNPHLYSSKKIAEGMSGKIFGKDLEACQDLWKAQGDKISAAALELLKEHSEKLKNWDGESFVI